jgi:hypothetical protein
MKNKANHRTKNNKKTYKKRNKVNNKNLMKNKVNPRIKNNNKTIFNHKNQNNKINKNQIVITTLSKKTQKKQKK